MFSGCKGLSSSSKKNRIQSEKYDKSNSSIKLKRGHLECDHGFRDIPIRLNFDTNVPPEFLKIYILYIHVQVAWFGVNKGLNPCLFFWFSCIYLC